jgi:hypothetical protein
LDLSHRSGAFWWAVFVVSAALGLSTEFLADILFPIWFEVMPKPSSIGGWLLGTPLAWFAPWLSFLALYLPEMLILTAFAFAIGRFFPNTWVRWLTVLTCFFVIIRTLRGGRPWTYALQAISSVRFDLAAGYVWMSVVILGSPYVSGWIVGRYLTPTIVVGDCCTKCGYPRFGLPSDVCPECGKKLDPMVGDAGQGTL